MGAKAWMLVYAAAASTPADALRHARNLDRDATLKLATTLFPKNKLERIGDGSLAHTGPPGNEIAIGCFPGVSIVAAKEFAIDHPSKLARTFIGAGGPGWTTWLHARHSVVDWFACAHWDAGGKLVRSLSLSPDSGVIEDIGTRWPFEAPWWSGQHPVADEPGEDAYPLPFHPLDLAEQAMREHFGFQLEGAADPSALDPEAVPLLRFRRSRSWWKFG